MKPIYLDYNANTPIAPEVAEAWKLFQHHKTFRMITEYILHPIAHLTGGHQHMAGMTHHDPSLHNSPTMKRRIIFLAIAPDQRPLSSPADDFGINVRRAPLFFVDVHLRTGEVLHVKDLPAGSSWGSEPTAMF